MMTYQDQDAIYEAREDDLQRRIEVLMAPGEDYDPLRPDNLSCVFADADYEGEFMQALAKALTDGRVDDVDSIIRDAAFDYIYPSARAEAEAQQEQDMDDIRKGVPGHF